MLIEGNKYDFVIVIGEKRFDACSMMKNSLIVQMSHIQRHERFY
jgi:hypothetical protein